MHCHSVIVLKLLTEKLPIIFVDESITYCVDKILKKNKLLDSCLFWTEQQSKTQRYKVYNEIKDNKEVNPLIG